MPSPREKAANRLQEILELLADDSLPISGRERLEAEHDAIIDNIAEGCYSNDPDDGVDWSTCPGIYSTPKIVTGSENVKFYCPEMTYKLWYKNDEGRMTYDDDIPEDIIDQYRDKIAETLDDAYFFRIKHPNVTGVTPGVEVHYGKLHGTLDVSLKGGLTQDSLEALQDELTDLTSRWSIYFESTLIKTDGGDLKIRFYDSNDPILTDTAFTNRAYMDNCITMTDAVKFYHDEGSGRLRMMYYNPDSNAGGQLVENLLYPDMLEAALDESETDEAFWNCVDDCAEQYLIDIDTPEFIAEARCFIEQPCDFSGQDSHAIDRIRSWVAQQQGDADLSPEMNM